MTYEQYWCGDPRLVIAYRKKHKLQIELENQKLWLQGLYIYDAVLAVAGAALAKKGTTPPKYTNKPYDLFEKQLSEDEIIEQRNKVINSLSQFQKAWGGNKKGK